MPPAAGKPRRKEPPMLDLNNNGVPDQDESWFWLTLVKVGAFLTSAFAPKHTIAFRAADAVRTEIDKRGL